MMHEVLSCLWLWHSSWTVRHWHAIIRWRNRVEGNGISWQHRKCPIRQNEHFLRMCSDGVACKNRWQTKRRKHFLWMFRYEAEGFLPLCPRGIPQAQTSASGCHIRMRQRTRIYIHYDGFLYPTSLPIHGCPWNGCHIRPWLSRSIGFGGCPWFCCFLRREGRYVCHRCKNMCFVLSPVAWHNCFLRHIFR